MDRLVFDGLNDREREITRLVAEGFGDREIAARVELSWGRVRNILSDIYDQVPACASGNPRVRLAMWYREIREHGYDQRTYEQDPDPAGLDALRVW